MSSSFFILASLVLLSAFFSASETALISLSKSKVDELVEKKTKNSRLLKKLKSNPHKVLITLLIGNNVVNTAASAYAAVMFTGIFGDAGIGIATGVMTFILLVFGEITPKSFAYHHAVEISTLVVKLVYLLEILLFPIVWFFEQFTKIISSSKKGHTVTEGELVAMLKIGTEEGSIEKQEKELIENVLEFSDIQVEAVMTPRVAIEALDSEMTIQEAVKFSIKHSHTRLPVYDGNIDKIIGILAVKDLLKYFDKYSVKRKIKNLKLAMPLEVPLSKKINKLFSEFQRKHVHMAIVIDEFGGTAGLVTFEDLLEEIVGEIADEFDVEDKPIEIVNENTLMVKGHALVEDINDFFRIKFWKTEHDTVNTVLMEHLHRFPREGDKIKFTDIRFSVLETRKNLVEKVKITKIKRKLKSV
jgi:CBS domain containing-hemolysin-like protein